MVKLITLAVLEESWKVCTFLSKGSPLFLKDEVISPKILTPSWLSCMLPPAIWLFLLVLFNSSRSCGSWGPRWPGPLSAPCLRPTQGTAARSQSLAMPCFFVSSNADRCRAPSLVVLCYFCPLEERCGDMGVVGCAGERSWRRGFWS